MQISSLWPLHHAQIETSTEQIFFLSCSLYEWSFRWNRRRLTVRVRWHGDGWTRVRRGPPKRHPGPPIYLNWTTTPSCECPPSQLWPTQRYAGRTNISDCAAVLREFSVRLFFCFARATYAAYSLTCRLPAGPSAVIFHCVNTHTR